MTRLLKRLLMCSFLLISTQISSQVNARTFGEALPGQPQDKNHPGSAHKSFTSKFESFQVLNRSVEVFLPREAAERGEKVPMIVFGHGQSLDVSVYRTTFEHLAQKGIAVVFPTFDTGFFDQDWRRMASDYAVMAKAATERYPVLDSSKVIYSGHSKGAYVASVAAGLPSAQQPLAPAALVFFNPAGTDSAWLKNVDPKIPATVIWSEADTIVKEQISLDLVRQLPNIRKQYIRVGSYRGTTPELKADHFFTLTKSTFFGGKDGPNPLHWYGSWKWLVGAALDLEAGARADNTYLYGAQTASTGLSGFQHEVKRNWTASNYQANDPLESVLDEVVHLDGIGAVAYRAPLAGNQGPAIVLFQGVFGGTTHRHLRELREELDQAGARVWTLDLPGTGQSDSPKRITEYAVLKKLIEVFLNQVVGEPAIVAAEQIMGLAALDVSQSSPTLFQKIVYLAPTGVRYLAQGPNPAQDAFFTKYWNDEPAAYDFYQQLVSEKSARFYLGKAYFDPASVTEDRIREITLTSVFVDQTWASLSFVGGRIYRSFQEASAGVSVPVTIVIGQAPAAPVTNGQPETVDLFQAIAPQFDYVVVPKAANLPHKERAAVVAEAILK